MFEISTSLGRVGLNISSTQADFRHLLPFGECGSGDVYCFDYSRPSDGAEMPVVVWFHETGETEVVAEDFGEFIEIAEKGKLDS
ncbi:MAG: SMI1/KNR4 family protein [Acidobacteriota bacterium]